MLLLILCKNFFQVQVGNKQAIVHEGTGYPSNRGAKSAIAFGLIHWLKQCTMNVLCQVIFGLLICQRCHMASTAVKRSTYTPHH